MTAPDITPIKYHFRPVLNLLIGCTWGTSFRTDAESFLCITVSFRSSSCVMFSSVVSTRLAVLSTRAVTWIFPFSSRPTCNCAGPSLAVYTAPWGRLSMLWGLTVSCISYVWLGTYVVTRLTVFSRLFISLAVSTFSAVVAVSL